MNIVKPKKLSKGSHIRVIAPSRSFKIISEDCRKIAKYRLEEMGFVVSYAEHADEMDMFASSLVQHRLDDLHEAFSDPSVDAIMTAIGGFNSNQLLNKIDYNLIKKNPKIICGFSDITALLTAIHAKTDVNTYYGPHFSTLGMKKGCDYTLEYFKKCLIEDKPFVISPSQEWSDDLWFIDQEKREFIKNDGPYIINNIEGEFEGNIIGGNLDTFLLLSGTDYMPSLKNAILFVEGAGGTDEVLFDRCLQSLTQQKDFDTVKAVVIGRFQKSSKIEKQRLEIIVKNKEALQSIPVVAGFDFGHTTPIFTLPIGGKAKLSLLSNKIALEIF